MIRRLFSGRGKSEFSVLISKRTNGRVCEKRGHFNSLFPSYFKQWRKYVCTRKVATQNIENGRYTVGPLTHPLIGFICGFDADWIITSSAGCKNKSSPGLTLYTWWNSVRLKRLDQVIRIWWPSCADYVPYNIPWHFIVIAVILCSPYQTYFDKNVRSSQSRTTSCELTPTLIYVCEAWPVCGFIVASTSRHLIGHCRN